MESIGKGDSLQVHQCDTGPLGTGISGTLTVMPSALNFGTVKVHRKASLKLTIKNTGVGVLHGNTELGALPKPFRATGGGKFTLAPGKTRVITVTFAPQKSDDYEGFINITSDDSAMTQPLVIIVAGVGQ